MVSGTGSRSAEVSKLFKSQYAIGKKNPTLFNQRLPRKFSCWLGHLPTACMPLNPSCRPLLPLRASRIRPHQGSLWIGRGSAGEGGGSWWWIGSAVPSCSRRRGCVSCWKSRKYHRSPQLRHSDHQVAFSIREDWISMHASFGSFLTPPPPLHAKWRHCYYISLCTMHAFGQPPLPPMLRAY